MASALQSLNLLGSETSLDDLVNAFGTVFAASVYSAPARAQQVIDRVLTIAEYLERPAIRARGLSWQAQLLAIRDGDYQQALEHYDQALALFEAEGLDLARARIEVTRVAVLGAAGRLQEALTASEWAAVVLSSEAEPKSLGSLRLNTAVALMSAGRYREALGRLEQAEEHFRLAGPEAFPSLLTTRVNRALCLASTGAYRQALALGEKTIADCKMAGLTMLQATQQLNSAQIRYCIGQYTTALRTLDELQAQSREDGFDHLRTMAGLSSADCLLLMGRYRDAYEICRGLGDELARRGDLRSSAQALSNSGIALAGLRKYADAQDALRSARGIFDGLDDRFGCGAVDWVAARIALSVGDLQSALRLGRSSVAQFSATDQAASLEAFQAKLLLPRVELEAGDLESAESGLEALRDLVRDRGPSWQHPVEALYARRAVIEGRDQDAIRHFRSAVELLEQAQVDIALELRAGYLDENGALYRSLVELLMAAGKAGEALEYAERFKARALVEQLRLSLEPVVVPLHAQDEQEAHAIAAWLEERAGIVYAIRRRSLHPEPESKALDQTDLEERLNAIEGALQGAWRRLVVRDAAYGLQRRQWQTNYESAQAFLGPDDLLLEFFDQGGTYVGFIVRAEGVTSFRVPMHESELRRLLQRLHVTRANLEASEGESQIARAKEQLLRVLEALYTGILLPIREYVAQSANLLVVPDGQLQLLPWSALYDGASHLIQRHTLSILPSSSILRYLTDTIFPETGLIAFGFDCEGRLPHALDEARSVADRWGGTALVGPDATIAAASEAIAGSTIVHFATHAVQHPGDPLLSGIELADGWLTCLDIHRLRGNSPLVVLSACQAGLNRAGQGEAIRGLAHAFLCAGAGSLVAPIQSVDDAVGRSLMLHFFEALHETESPARALRLATCNLLQQSGSQPRLLARCADFQVMARI